MPEDYVPHLQKCDLFANIEPGLLELLNNGCRWVRLRANEPLFHEGAPGGSIYVVCSGEVAIERTHFRGDDKEEVVLLNLRRPYEVIGELSLFDHDNRTASARSTADRTMLLMVDGRYLNRCLEQSHALSLAMLKTVMGKLKQAIERRTDERSAPIPIRLAKHLLDLAEHHGEVQQNGAVQLRERVTQQDLANRIGCSREMVNKVIQGFGPGVVETVRGRITIRKPKRLEAISNRPY